MEIQTIIMRRSQTEIRRKEKKEAELCQPSNSKLSNEITKLAR
jgi:hypothetical protein